jgi:hypothetical protein
MQNVRVMRRRGWSAVVAATVGGVVAVLFAPALLRGEIFSFRDHADYFQPLRFFTAQALSHGVVPLWNPYNGSGEPWLANPQTGIFYPPQWIFVLLPFARAYVVYLALHALLLGWSGYRLFARDGGEKAALVGAVALMTCGPTLSLLDVQNNYCTFAFMPLLILLGIRRGEGSVSRTACSATIALAFLAGEPFLAGFGALLFALAFAITRSERSALPRSFGTATIDLAATAAMALALAAVQLFPFLAWVRGSDRAAASSNDDLLRESMRPLDWVRLALPSAIENDLRSASQQFVPVLYCGAFIVALFLCGLLAGVRKHRRGRVLSWLALLGVAIIGAGGRFIPLTGVLAARLTLSRYPARLVPVGCLAVIAIAVIGLGWIESAHQRLLSRGLIVLLAVFTAVDLIPRAEPLLATRRFEAHVVPYRAPIGRSAKLIRLPDETWSGHRPFDRKSWIAGYQNLFERRFDASTASPLLSASYARLYDAALFTPRPDLLRLMSVGWMLTSRRLPAAFLTPAESSGVVTLYRFDSTLPFVQAWAGVSSSVSDQTALDSTLRSPLRGVVPVSGRTPVAWSALPAAPDEVDRVDALAIDLNEVRLRLRLSSARLVVITQRAESGWTADVDGREAPTLRAAGIFRAVVLGPGRHSVVWTYRPMSLIVGALITLAGLAWASLDLLRSRRDEGRKEVLGARRREHTPAPSGGSDR